MITVQELYHDYSGKGDYAVKNISFEIEKGEIFGFLGPSGAGKSTVQNIMTGLLKLQKGSVNYEGLSVKELRTDFFNRIGVSFEQPNVYSRLSGYENLKYFAGLFSVPTLEPLEILRRVGLGESAHKRAGEYSKGMLQRLNVARALLNRGEILFLDEPTSGLDPATAASIKELILEQKSRGATIFLTTHNMYLADELCDRVAFIESGSLAAMDTPTNLKQIYGQKSVLVKYAKEEALLDKTFMLDEAGRQALGKFLSENTPITLHSQEATLEAIFLRITGKELTQ